MPHKECRKANLNSITVCRNANLTEENWSKTVIDDI